MERDVSLDEISDGKLYESNDMVKADCGGCNGCFACCRGMGSSIILDPLDVYRLSKNLNSTFEELLVDKIELHLVDGVILPNLKMVSQTEQCAFLDEEGRCSIHGFRPGICRLFPLGRYYENQGFKYFLQVHECKKENKTKVKVRKWIDTPNLKDNEQFIIDWHYFLKNLQVKAKQQQDLALMKDMSMYVLEKFYVQPYKKDVDFYLQFKERFEILKENCQIGAEYGRKFP